MQEFANMIVDVAFRKRYRPLAKASAHFLLLAVADIPYEQRTMPKKDPEIIDIEYEEVK